MSISNLRSSCVVDNCKTHPSVANFKDSYVASLDWAHYNCTSDHPCLECVACPDCKSGKSYHPSNHSEWQKPKRKARVVLNEAQKQEILNLHLNGASIADLASQFNAHRNQISKILKT